MGYFIGACLACYFLVGRWNLLRLENRFDDVPFYTEPRVWILTVAALAVLMFSCFNRCGWWYRFRLLSVDAALLLFLAYMLASSMWAPDPELASAKAFEVGLLLSATLVTAISRQRDAATYVTMGFFATLLAIGGAMALVAIYKSTGGRVYAPGGGPNTFGRNMGLMALAAIVFASRAQASAPSKIVAAGFVVLAMLLVMMCGSRGGLLSASVGAMTLILLAHTSISRKIMAVGALALLSYLALFYTPAGQNALEVFEHRIVQQTIEDRYMSSRDDLWGEAVELGCLQPWLGLGLNGYRANSWTYPHNLVLEIWVEGGAVGLLLLLLIGQRFVRTAWKQWRHISRPGIAAMMLALAAAQTSGDLYDSRGVFLLMAIVAPVNMRAFSVTNKAFAARRPSVPIIGMQPSASS